MERHKNIFNTNLIYFLVLILFVGVRICSSLGLFSFLGESGDIVLTVVVQIVILFLFPLFLISKLNKKSPLKTLQDFNFRKVNAKSILISIAIGVIVFFLTIVISVFFNYIIELLGYSPVRGTATKIDTWGKFAVSMLTIAVLPAFCEEFLHRGALLSAYKPLGLSKAIFYSSLLFGLLHLSVEKFFYASIIGAVLGTVTLFSRSIIPAMIIHFLNNGINVYLSFASETGLFGGDFTTKFRQLLFGDNFFASIIFITFFVALLVFLLFYLISALLTINAKESIRNYAESAAIEQMRQEVLGENEKPKTPARPLIIFSKSSLQDTLKVNIPYEALGFYIAPQVTPTLMDNLFLYSSLLLGGLITIFTFIWGVI